MDTPLLEEPEWLEAPVIQGFRVWHIMFACFAGIVTIIVMICCCVKFRIPRTKQEIDADYQRRLHIIRYRKFLKAIPDADMEKMSFKEASERLYEKTKMEEDPKEAQPSSKTPEIKVEESEPQPSGSGMKFAKTASKIATLSKLAPKSPTTRQDSQ